ncbi:MAG TPA: proline--tRNA ligase [bacterium]
MTVRWSRYFLPTLREDPKDAEAVSHKLMMRAGLIRRLGSGAYSYLPFGKRALERAAAVVRREMDAAGAHELLLPALQPTELWKATGRYGVLGDVLIRFTDRTGKEIALGPTHEEVITDLMTEVSSHKALPLTLYQIQTKFRDEPRPRFGVIRSKEFLMKDAYSFDLDAEGLARSYRAMYEAYVAVFARCGIHALPCEADPGIMGGDVSHEFMAPSEHGEDRVVRCAGCGYAANLEAARCPEPPEAPPGAETQQPMAPVKTPGRHTVDDVSRLLKVPASRLIKTLLYDVDETHVGVLVRGDHDVNEAKLARIAGTTRVRLAGADAIRRLSGAPVGFTGPVGLSGVRLLADRAVMTMINAVTGANENETHLVNVNPGRDFRPDEVADVRIVAEGDCCPGCGKPLEFLRTIEVGHVFKLGTKYTQALGAVVQDPSGASRPMIMGCYGIGINRLLAAAIEQHHDAQGIVWPVSLAPFQALISVLEPQSGPHRDAAEAAAAALEAAGIDVLVDDREQSPGSKLKDADLIGIPVQLIVGKTWSASEQLEARRRGLAERAHIRREEVVATVKKLLDTPVPV